MSEYINPYKEAMPGLKEAIWNWREEINELCPEPDGTYLNPWDETDADYVKSSIFELTDKIMNGTFGNHMRYEFNNVREIFLPPRGKTFTVEEKIAHGKEGLHQMLSEISVLLQTMTVLEKKWKEDE